MAAALIPEPSLAPGRYRHYKGGEYEVIGLACHSETHEWLVVYRPLYEHAGLPDLWVRPYTMFTEEVTVDGVTQPRFAKVTRDSI